MNARRQTGWKWPSRSRAVCRCPWYTQKSVKLSTSTAVKPSGASLAAQICPSVRLAVMESSPVPAWHASDCSTSGSKPCVHISCVWLNVHVHKYGLVTHRASCIVSRVLVCLRLVTSFVTQHRCRDAHTDRLAAHTPCRGKDRKDYPVLSGRLHAEIVPGDRLSVLSVVVRWSRSDPI